MFVFQINKSSIVVFFCQQDIADAQMEYFKLMTPGHHQIPSEHCYQQFASTVRNYLEKNKNNGKPITIIQNL